MEYSIFKAEIAEHLKAERKRRKLSLDATAKLTGVSKAMLGQIEREESSPTIATLWKIASGLETSFSAFFTKNSGLHSGERVFPEDKCMKVKTLFPFKSDSRIEVFEITLMDFHRQMSEPHSVGVIEHVQVITGNLNVFFEQKWHSLHEGETVRFYSDQPHGYEAENDRVVFQNIVCYPK